MARPADELLSLVYDELRSLARHYLNAEDSCQTLDPTGLVHEAYLRLVKLDRMVWKDRVHFFAMAATEMRRVLVERARAACATKRGARAMRITFVDGPGIDGRDYLETLALDEALEKLAQRSPRQARVAEMHVFAGLRMDEIGAVLSLSERTIKREFSVARAWLARELRKAV
jgi:RNA polymerase sigma factor (TIGR02999 family)